MNLNYFLPFAFIVFVLFSGCTKKSNYEPLPFPEGSQEAIDNAAIIEYLDKNEIIAENTASGIYYVIETPGEGEHPTAKSTVTTNYRGTMLDGKEFDSSYKKGKPISFKLNGVIKGWTEGIPLLKAGGKGKLFIPSGLAYGPRGYPGLIPPNSPLIFEIELVSFVDQEVEDANIISSYCSTNNLDYQKTASGIYYKIEVEGEGEHPTVTNKVTCHYTGTFLDGTKFDSSYDQPGGQPIEFALNRVIPGWTQCIPLLKKGGKGQFIIPSGLAYGPMGNPRGKTPIPPNTVLKFEVELVDFK